MNVKRKIFICIIKSYNSLQIRILCFANYFFMLSFVFEGNHINYI